MAAVGRISRALRQIGASGRRPSAAAAGTPAVKRAAAKRPAERPAPAKKAVAKKAAPVKKTVVKKAAAKKAAPVKKAAATKATPVRKAAAKKAAPVKKAVAKKAAPVKKAAATKATPAKKAAVKKAAPAPAKKAASAKTAAPSANRAAPDPIKDPIAAIATKKLPPQKPAAAVEAPTGSEWSKAELAEIRGQLVDELTEMRGAYEISMRDLDNLQRSSTDGAGDDQADAGSKTFEREQEQSIAANRFDLMSQIERAVERIDGGTYGYCENCGKPIPKARLRAFPAATLDVACKQREERR